MRDARIGIIGCGQAARVHLGRLVAVEGVTVVGCADPVEASALAFAEAAPRLADGARIPTFADHNELIRAVHPEAVAVFTPHLAHYRPTLDALQAGCDVFVEKPLSMSVQEAVDIVNVARARGRQVAVGHQYRLLPSLREAKARLAAGAIGPVHLVVATLAQPWLGAQRGEENRWRFDPKVSGGGILADTGDHLIDALLWSTGQAAVEVAAVQSRLGSGIDLVTAAALRLADGSVATLGLSGQSASVLFELTYFGESGRIRVNETRLTQHPAPSPGEADRDEGQVAPLPAPIENIDGDFLAAIRGETPPCCSAEDALDTVRLLEAIARSAATGQLVRLG